MSTKCYYAFIKGPTEKEISDESLKVIIKNLQNFYDNSLGYRKMTVNVNMEMYKSFEIEMHENMHFF